MIEKGRISKRQALMLLFTAIIGTKFLFLPRFILDRTFADGLLILCLATLLAGIFFFLIYKTLNRFPEQTIFQICQTVLGKYLGKLLGLAYVVGALALSALVTRSLGEFFITIVMPETPLSFFIIAILILSVVTANYGIEGIGRLNEFWLPIIIFSFVLIFMGSGNSWEFNRLKPIMMISAIPEILTTSLSISTVFLQAGALLFFYPFVKEKKGILKSSWMTIFLSAIFLLGIYASVIGVFGKDMPRLFTWPTLELARNIQFASWFERMEALFVIIWVLLAFLKISLYTYAANLGFAQVFELKKIYFWVSIALAGPTYFIAFQPKNIAQVLRWVEIWEVYGLTAVFTLIIPGILFAIAIVRGKGGKKVAKQE